MNDYTQQVLINKLEELYDLRLRHPISNSTDADNSERYAIEKGIRAIEQDLMIIKDYITCETITFWRI